MKTTRNELEKFNETVDILVKAYLNDTLEKGNCYACAVGNIIAARNKYKIIENTMHGRRYQWDGFNNVYANSTGENERLAMWTSCFFTNGFGLQKQDSYNYKGQAKKQILSSGYTLKQLMRIENAFEIADGEFNSLMAVVDVLADIHKVDLSVKESAKLQFVKI